MERAGVPPNEISYNTAIRACGGAGELSEALRLMDEMEERGVKASVVTYGTAMAACQKQADWKMVREKEMRWVWRRAGLICCLPRVIRLLWRGGVRERNLCGIRKPGEGEGESGGVGRAHMLLAQSFGH